MPGRTRRPSSGENDWDGILDEGVNIQAGTTTGTKIGTSTSQKFGFYNATPITQPASTGGSQGFTAGGLGQTVTDDSTWTGGVGSTAYKIGDIVKNLKNVGLLKS